MEVSRLRTRKERFRSDLFVERYFTSIVIGRESYESGEEKPMLVGEEKPMLVGEFLVVWPEPIRITKSFGLNLAMKKNFGQYYDDNGVQNPVSFQGK